MLWLHVLSIAAAFELEEEVMKLKQREWKHEESWIIVAMRSQIPFGESVHCSKPVLKLFWGITQKCFQKSLNEALWLHMLSSFLLLLLQKSLLSFFLFPKLLIQYFLIIKILNLLTRTRTWTLSELFVCTCHCFQTDKVKQDKMNLDKLYIILKV